jgi:integrase
MWLGVVDLGYDGTGKRRRKYVSSRDYATAVRKLRALRREAEEGDLATGALTVDKWITHWLDDIAAARVRPRTLDTYRGYVTRYISPSLGKRRLDKVTPQHIRALHASMSHLSPTTTRQAHAIVVKAFSDARREGHKALDVGDRMDPPRKAASDRQALSVPQAITLLRYVDGKPYGSRWAAALLMGARQGECLGLEWDRVDLTSGVADLSWQLQRLPHRHGCDGKCGRKRAGNCPARELAVPKGFEHRIVAGGLVMTRPKSQAGVRLVPLIPVMVRALEQLPHRDGFVWRRDDGRPVDPKDDSAAWHRALSGAGLPDMPLHSARHTTATLLRTVGTDMATVEQVMGHASAAATAAYLHMDLTLARAGYERMGALLALDRPAIEG